jgi:beta-1,4-mannosyltransferase
MQYHTLSLSQAGYEVDVVAMQGSQPIAALRQATNVHIHSIPQLPAWANKLPPLPGLLLKAVFQLLALLVMLLLQLPRPAAILMQNPPAVPSMLVCWLAAARHRAAWVVDWHNTAFSIMQLKYARFPWLISLARSIEQQLGRRAAAHFCVTKAFKQWLEADFGLSGVQVLYDRPPAMFHRCSLPEMHALLQRLQPALAADGVGTCLQQQLAAAMSAQGGTLLTQQQAGGAQGPTWRPGRPALVVSSTSWTPDEDFGILLAAAEAYDAAAAASSSASGSYPDVVVVITGRGPQREMYLSRIRQLHLSKVAFCSMWLEPEDYPLILGAADLGVCLHTSSSGERQTVQGMTVHGSTLRGVASARTARSVLLH